MPRVLEALGMTGMSVSRALDGILQKYLQKIESTLGFSK